METVIKKLETELVAACCELVEENEYEKGMLQAFQNILSRIQTHYLKVEKKQIKKAYDAGFGKSKHFAEHYYNETYREKKTRSSKISSYKGDNL